MEHHELIAKANEHVGKIQPRDSAALSAADFPQIQIRETAMVCFQSEERKDRVFIFLDRHTGEFITIMYGGCGAQFRSQT